MGRGHRPSVSQKAAEGLHSSNQWGRVGQELMGIAYRNNLLLVLSGEGFSAPSQILFSNQEVVISPK